MTFWLTLTVNHNAFISKVLKLCNTELFTTVHIQFCKVVMDYDNIMNDG